LANYNQIVSFGGVYFELADVRVSKKSGTLKTQIGKTFIEKDIPLRDVTDIVLEVNGVITGLSRTSGQSQSTAIENDRTSLIALEDGTYHAWDDGRHSGNFAIVKGSLIFNDEAARTSGEPQKFTMTLVEWSGS